MISGLLTGSIISLLWISLQIGLMHIWPTKNRFNAMLIGYLVSLPIIYLFCDKIFMYVQPEDFIKQTRNLSLIHAYLSHLLIFFLYAECFYHLDRSVTLKILTALLKQQNTNITIENIRQSYDLNKMIEPRLETLKHNNFICLTDEKWHLKPKGKTFSIIMRISEWLFQSKGQSDSA